jgi:hypothetical protein
VTRCRLQGAYDDVKAANERMSMKITRYSELELRMQSQEIECAARLHALAAEAAVQVQAANQQRDVSEATTAVAVAQARELQQQLDVMNERLSQQQQLVNSEQSRDRSSDRSSKYGQDDAEHPQLPALASPLFSATSHEETLHDDFDQHAAAVQASGVGSRWNLLMKSQIRQQQQQQQQQEEDQVIEHGRHMGNDAHCLERSPPPPSTAEQLASATATITHHNEHIQHMHQETETLRGQLMAMQTRAETSERQLQQILASSSTAQSAAASFSPQRTLTVSSTVAAAAAANAAAATADAAAAAVDGSNLLQLSQLTAQVVLDCRRMTEVNHEHLRHMQVARQRA